MALAYLTGTVTQGSADAFAEAQVATALQGLSNVAFRVREILFERSSVGAASSTIALWLARRTKAAQPRVSDRDVLAMWNTTFQLTTSGAEERELVHRQVFSEDDELLIVEDPLYLGIDSGSTSQALTGYVRIGYERVSISALDRLTLLTASLE